MSKGFCRKYCRGLATLEAAAAATLLFSLLFGIFGVVEVMQEDSFVDSLVESALLDSDVKALEADYSSGSLVVEVNDQGLSDLIESIKSEVEQEYLQHYAERGQNPESYVEVVYASVAIDSETGAPVGAVSVSESQVVGDKMMVPVELEVRTRLPAMITQLAAEVDAQGRSVWATPLSVNLESGYSVEKYVPAVCFVGLRVFIDSADGLAQQLRTIMGLEPVYFKAKAFTLRGDIEL